MEDSEESGDITALELAMGAMFTVFMTNQGDDGKLSQSAFLNVLKEEMPSFNQGDPKFGEEIFYAVDINQDGSVEFKEFAMMMAMVASSNFEALQAAMKRNNN